MWFLNRQEIADFLGDSLGLSRIARDKTNTEYIIFAGVDFMAETASIVNQDKHILIPNYESCCPMAAYLTADMVRDFKKNNSGLPVVTYVTKVTAEADKIVAERDVGDKMVTVESSYPVVLTTTKELNEPRLPNMMQILQAANKKIETWGAGDLGVTPNQFSSRLTTSDVKGFQMDRKNIMIDGEPDEAAEKLINHLKEVLGR